MNREFVKKIIRKLNHTVLNSEEKLYMFTAILLLKKINHENWKELVKDIQAFKQDYYEKKETIKTLEEFNGLMARISNKDLAEILSLSTELDPLSDLFTFYEEYYGGAHTYDSLYRKQNQYLFLAQAIGFENVKTIYDMAFGIGEGFLAIIKEHDYKEMAFIGQEKEPLLWANMKNIFEIRKINSDHLYLGDTLTNPGNVVEEEMQQYDFTIVDPPQNEKVDKSVYENDEHMRFKYGQSEKSEFTFLEHGLRSTKDDGTIVAFINANALKKPGKEKIIRKNLLHDRSVDAIIQLADDQREEFCILILTRKEQDEKTLLIDLTRSSKDRLFQLSALYKRGKDDKSDSLLYDQSDFKKDEFILLPSYYIEKETFKNATKSLSGLEDREMVPIEDIATISSGLSTAVKLLKEKEDRSHPNKVSFVKSSDIEKDGTVNLTEEGYYWYGEKISGIERTLLEEDDILLLTRGDLDKIGIIVTKPEQARFGAGMNTLKISVDREKYSPYLLFELLRSEFGKQQMKMVTTETRGIKRLNVKEFTQLKIPVFTEEERTVFDKAYKRANEREKELRRELEEMKELKEQTLKDILNKK
ncbi:MAG TPA: N-6 DNA methylase [Thermotogota bacterium]|nr:N-6 DNA methylase [Thermotogota bacterium]HPR96215.1 N-6 DNA methylase [Thermotogota bacterium]